MVGAPSPAPGSHCDAPVAVCVRGPRSGRDGLHPGGDERPAHRWTVHAGAVHLGTVHFGTVHFGTAHFGTVHSGPLHPGPDGGADPGAPPGGAAVATRELRRTAGGDE